MSSPKAESVTQESYTDLILNEEKCRLCPECHQPRVEGRDWVLQKGGYKKMLLGYTNPIPNCCLKDLQMKSRFFLGNPSIVTTCQNAWNPGLNGSPCTFIQEKFEGFPKRDLETKDNVGTSRQATLAYCPRCSHTKEDVVKCPELKAYIEPERTLATCADGKSYYRKLEYCPWEGKYRFVRAFVWDGEEDVIRCKSGRFGKGLEKGSEEITCSGFYEDCIVFGDNEEQADGSFKRKDRTLEPGEFDPAPETAPPSPQNLLSWTSSSDELSANSDQGYEQGEWSSSS